MSDDTLSADEAIVVIASLKEMADELRCQLAATQIKLAAARLALAACREVREGRES